MNVKSPVRNSNLNMSTTAYPWNGRPAKPPERRLIALVPGSRTHLTDEIHSLLRRRLRIAGLIALAGNAYFFFRAIAVGNDTLLNPPMTIGLQGCVLGLMMLLSALLWSRVVLGVRELRLVELALFGSMVAYFGYIQITTIDQIRILANMVEGRSDDVLRIGTAATALRWFVLITLYGTFIPNTWKRCALVVGAIAVTPLLLTFFACSGCHVMGPYVGSTTFDLVVLLAIASAIAIFGSYKISELQQEAFQARKLGQYQLHRRLGAGGMGEVFLAEHILLRRSCAIKLIRPEQAGDPTNLSRFEREVQAMATLTHWNTVEIFDYGHTPDGTFYYVMEYLPGLSLQELVDRHGPLAPGRAIHFLRQVCAALKEAHAIGLVHRDIKPSNIIASQRGGVHDVAKLLDFGLVIHHISSVGNSSDQKLTIQGTVLGSPPYISPEQARGKGDIDARTDIYSLGGLGYFLLTGQPPFVRDSAMELLVAHIHEPAQPLRELRPEIPHDLEQIILRCLSKVPGERFGSANVLERALADCEAVHHWDHDRAEQWWQAQGETKSERETALVAVSGVA